MLSMGLIGLGVGFVAAGGLVALPPVGFVGALELAPVGLAFGVAVVSSVGLVVGVSLPFGVVCGVAVGSLPLGLTEGVSVASLPVGLSPGIGVTVPVITRDMIYVATAKPTIISPMSIITLLFGIFSPSRATFSSI